VTYAIAIYAVSEAACCSKPAKVRSRWGGGIVHFGAGPIRGPFANIGSGVAATRVERLHKGYCSSLPAELLTLLRPSQKV
jgi:hypothetical protein